MMFDKRWLKIGAVMSNAVITKCVLIYLGYWAGTKLDNAYGTQPYFMLGLIILAMVLGITWILWMAKRFKI